MAKAVLGYAVSVLHKYIFITPYGNEITLLYMHAII